MNKRLRPFNPDEPLLYSDADVEVRLSHEVPQIEFDADGAKTTILADGSAEVDFNPEKAPELNKGFYANLADGKLDESELDRIAQELLDDIDSDIQSRAEWLQTRARGVELLGFKLEEPRGDLGASSAPLEGMSTIRHPLLAEAILRFQANARGELLPASGPVKVRNDAPPAPEGMEAQSGLQDGEILASAMETDFNHYLTSVATEYYPDTDRMLFQIGFGGLGIKKVYNCPIKRRPVSETIPAEDFIVSNTATDMQSSGRITHRIKMRPSILKRMQLVGAYRDVPLDLTATGLTDTLQMTIAEQQGIKPVAVQNTENVEQEIYETYCELDLEGHEHEDKGKKTGLRLPYKVSIHIKSRKVLEVRRNWLKDDKLFMPREYFVDFPFVPAFGFYPLGLLHILGNTASTLTAAWREMLDAGMFASFPGFLYAKMGGRQLTNQFRVPPGGGIPIDVGMGSIKDMIMPLPYKEPGPSLTAFIQHVEEVGQRLGSTADTNVGEGKQDVPVGTTLALIEQATKILDAVHKRLHSAQAKEFKLLKERFREDPEAFWRFNKKPAYEWEKKQFLQALENCEVVPVADPNNPTSLHRIAKATAIKQLQAASPLLYDSMAVDKRIMKIIGVDSEGLFLDKPADPPPDPRMEAIKAKSEQAEDQNQANVLQQQIKAHQTMQQSQDKAADRVSRERLEAMKLQLEREKQQTEAIIHQQKTQQDMAMKAQEGQQKMAISQAQHQQKLQHEREKMAMEAQLKSHETNIKAQQLQAESQISQQQSQDQLMQQREIHDQKMQQMQADTDAKQQQKAMDHDDKISMASDMHQTKLEHTKQMGETKIELAKKQAKIKPKTPTKGGK